MLENLEFSAESKYARRFFCRVRLKECLQKRERGWGGWRRDLLHRWALQCGASWRGNPGGPTTVVGSGIGSGSQVGVMTWWQRPVKPSGREGSVQSLHLHVSIGPRGPCEPGRSSGWLRSSVTPQEIGDQWSPKPSPSVLGWTHLCRINITLVVIRQDRHSLHSLWIFSCGFHF